MKRNRIRAAFRNARKEGRPAFIPYITGGDPDLETTSRLIRELDRLGADMIEIGVPFSDPVADGIVNQKAAERALLGGTTLTAILGMVKRLREEVDAGLVLFTYFNPVHRFGVEAFARAAADAGIDAVLAVDLPPEEGDEYRGSLNQRGVETVFLLAPTSSPERIKRIAGVSTGFLYYVSRTGVTGTSDRLDGDLLGSLRRLRAAVKLPIAVGFGISRPEHIAALRDAADGVVVGSAIVRLIGEGGSTGEILKRVGDFVRWLQPAGRP